MKKAQINTQNLILRFDTHRGLSQSEENKCM